MDGLSMLKNNSGQWIGAGYIRFAYTQKQMEVVFNGDKVKL